MAYLAVCSIEPIVTNNGTIQCDGVLSIVDTSTLIPVFQITDVDMVLAGQYFAGAFVFLGIVHVTALALRYIMSAIKGRF